MPLSALISPVQRSVERQKYETAYRAQTYRMGDERRASAVQALKSLSHRGSLLDVACGRGEMLREAETLGFGPVAGTEMVQALLTPRIVYAEAHDLPFDDDAFDTVTMFDVMEHLIPGDDEAACREIERVARRSVILTIANCASRNAQGEDLHINRRPYEEWDGLLRSWFSGTVTWEKSLGNRISQLWRITL